MLRRVDLDLAVKTGVIDQDLRDKFDCSTIDDSVSFSTETALREEVKKLNEVIVQLSKELLDKTKQLEDMRKNLDYLVNENDGMSRCIDEYRSDRDTLEKIIDKLEKRK